MLQYKYNTNVNNYYKYNCKIFTVLITYCGKFFMVIILSHSPPVSLPFLTTFPCLPVSMARICVSLFSIA